MTHVPLEELESVALDELRGRRAEEIAEHVALCAECAHELAWLRAEKALLARRPAPDTSQLWAGVASRLQHPRRRPRWAWRAAGAAAATAAAAAVALVALRPRPPLVTPALQPQVAQQQQKQPRQRKPVADAKTLAALDRAETDYRDAAKVLEDEYARLRPALDPDLARRWDETLTRARTQLGESRAVAADDVNARMRVLDGYAGYLRSLRDVVQESEEANP